ncbi:MAG TPA: PDZ domain-containing protein [Kofleriaceae bacterium]
MPTVIVNAHSELTKPVRRLVPFQGEKEWKTLRHRALAVSPQARRSRSCSSRPEIAGTVRSAGVLPDEIDIMLRDEKTGFPRRKEFFRTGGTFTIRDVPSGHFTITAAGGGGTKQVRIDLANGEHKPGVDIQVDSRVALTGRLVNFGTTTPVAGMLMYARLGTELASGPSQLARGTVSDAAGRFTIKNAPTGLLEVSGFPRDPFGSNYASVRTVLRVDGSGTIDVGDVGVLRNRIKCDDVEGYLGIRWAEQPPNTPPEQWRYEVSWIDPNGGAVNTGLEVGDVVTAIDGIDISGVNHARSFALMRAPSGTKLALGLARAATVTVTLSAPR